MPGGGGKDVKVPNAPDVSNQVNLGSKTALGTIDLAQKNQELFGQQYSEGIWPYADRFMSDSEKASHEAQDMATQVGNTYAEFGPAASRYLRDAEDYASPVRQAQNAGLAAAASMNATNASIKAERDRMAGYGFSPTEGPSLAAESALRLGGTADAVSKAMMARLGTVDRGFELRKSALDLFNQQPTQYANLSNIAGNRALAGLQGGAGAFKTGSDVLGDTRMIDASTRAIGGATNAITQQGQLAQEAAANQMKAASNQAGGIGSILGTGAKIIGSLAFPEAALPLAAASSVSAPQSFINAGIA